MTENRPEPFQIRRRRADASALLVSALPGNDWADAFGIGLPVGASDDVDVWRRRLFDTPGTRPGRLLSLRNLVAPRLGLRPVATAPGTGFPVVAADQTEIVVGSDDRHLDFRVSVTLEPVPGAGDAPDPTCRVHRELVVTTVVKRHNLLGHLYFAMIRPGHHLLVPQWTRRAVRDAGAAALASGAATLRRRTE